MVNRLFYFIFAVIMFCISIFLLLYQAATYHQALVTIKNRMQKDEMYQQYDEGEEEIVAYGFLIATLLNDLDYDIQINEVEITKAEHKPYRIEQYPIKHSSYKKSYKYNDYGDIIKVLYQSTENDTNKTDNYYDY